MSAFADYMVGEKWHESDSKAAAAMGRAVDAVIDAGGPLTPDIGGDATTEAMGSGGRRTHRRLRRPAPASPIVVPETETKEAMP